MTFPRLLRLVLPGLLVVAALETRALAGDQPPTATPDPFTLFRSTTELSESERERLARGEVVAKMLPADGLQVGFFGAMAVQADAHVVHGLLNRIRAFRKGPRVIETRQFSQSPQLSDLDELELPERDLEALSRCRPESCDLKLTRSEIERIQDVVRRNPDDSHDALQRAFRKIVLERTLRYVMHGHRGTPPLQSRSEPVDLAERVSDLIEEMPTLTEGLPDLAEYIEHYPHARLPEGAESFLYWTIEDLRQPVVIVRHAIILHSQDTNGRPVLISASNLVLATHYLDASVGLATLVQGEPGASRNYFVYINRTALDFLDGFPAWLRRRLVSRAVEGESVKLLLGIRDKIERRARELRANGGPF